MWIAFFWFLFAIACAVFASNRGRSAIGWFVIAVLLSPLIALIFLLVTKDLSRSAAQTVPNETTHVRCPACAEFVLPQATVCKHCGTALATTENMAKIAARRQASRDADNDANKVFGWIFAGLVLVLILAAIT